MCACASRACACVCDYRKFTECKTEIYEAKPAESIISYITTLTYQMTICRPNAVRPMCCLRAECVFHIFWVSVSEHLVGIGTVPNLQRRSECLNSQWKEVGREEGKHRHKDEWKERVNDRTVTLHIRNSYSKLLHHGDPLFDKG